VESYRKFKKEAQEEEWYEIIDDGGVIFSGSKEEMYIQFESMKEGADTFEWKGDLKLVKVIDIYK